jgi:hypothetical protein
MSSLDLSMAVSGFPVCEALRSSAARRYKRRKRINRRAAEVRRASQRMSSDPRQRRRFTVRSLRQARPKHIRTQAEERLAVATTQTKDV